jgi:hypothetical protein
MFSTIIASCIGGLLAIIIAVFFFRKKGKPVKEEIKNEINKEPEKSADSPELLIENTMDNLLYLNVFIRTKKVPENVLNLVETMIDNLMVATPAMIDRHPEHDLTYELKQMCHKHIMKQLKEFSDMSESNQQKYMDGLVERLNEMADLIKRARDIVETDEVTEMKMIAGFLETKYSKPIG